MTTTDLPKHVVCSLPGLDSDALERLTEAQAKFESIGMNIENVCGEISVQHWIAELDRVPTVEDIGATWLFIQYARDAVASITMTLDTLEKNLGTVDSLRLEKLRREVSAVQ